MWQLKSNVVAISSFLQQSETILAHLKANQDAVRVVYALFKLRQNGAYRNAPTMHPVLNLKYIRIQSENEIRSYAHAGTHTNTPVVIFSPYLFKLFSLFFFVQFVHIFI